MQAQCCPGDRSHSREVCCKNTILQVNTSLTEAHTSIPTVASVPPCDSELHDPGINITAACPIHLHSYGGLRRHTHAGNTVNGNHPAFRVPRKSAHSLIGCAPLLKVDNVPRMDCENVLPAAKSTGSTNRNKNISVEKWEALVRRHLLDTCCTVEKCKVLQVSGASDEGRRVALGLLYTMNSPLDVTVSNAEQFRFVYRLNDNDEHALFPGKSNAKLASTSCVSVHLHIVDFEVLHAAFRAAIGHWLQNRWQFLFCVDKRDCATSEVSCVVCAALLCRSLAPGFRPNFHY